MDLIDLRVARAGHDRAVVLGRFEVDRVGGASHRAEITGAGGGGFLLLYVPYEYQGKVRTTLKSFQELPFRLEADGSKVIFNYRRF